VLGKNSGRGGQNLLEKFHKNNETIILPMSFMGVRHLR